MLFGSTAATAALAVSEDDGAQAVSENDGATVVSES